MAKPKNVQKMSKEQIEKELATLEPIMEQTRVELARVQELWQTNYHRHQELTRQKAELVYQEQLDNGQVDWATIIQVLPGDPYHKVLQKELRRIAPLGSINYSGQYLQSSQAAFQVKIDRGNKEQVKEAKAVIEMLFPLLNPVVEDLVLFKIFENSLSYHCQYKMGYNVKTKEWFCGEWHNYGQTHFRGKPLTLEEALKQVSEYYWYQDPNAKDD